MRAAFAVAIGAASPSNLVRRSRLPQRLSTCPPAGESVILAVGKAGADMAEGLMARWPLARPPRGMVLVPHGNARSIGNLEVRSGGHPYADQHSVAAGKAILDLVGGLGATDRLLVLLSGGGSALASTGVDASQAPPRFTLGAGRFHRIASTSSGVDQNRSPCFAPSGWHQNT